MLTTAILLLYACLLGGGAGAACGAILQFLAQLGLPWGALLALMYLSTAVRLFTGGFLFTLFHGVYWRESALWGLVPIVAELLLRRSVWHALAGAVGWGLGVWLARRERNNEKLNDVRVLLLSPFNQSG